MADISKLEQQANFADEYGDRIAEWELFAIALICREIGKIGKMTPEQAKKFDAEKETKKTEKSNTENAVVEVEEYHEEKEALRKIHNCLNCAEYGNNGCGQIMFEKMTDYPDFMCEGFSQKKNWIETGSDGFDDAIQCPYCGLWIPCNDYEEAKKTHKFCYECGRKIF